MKSKDNGFITSSQAVAIITGTIIGSEILYLPHLLVEYGGQDGWIYSALGAVYPIYLVLMASFLCNRFPDDNILKLSKKYLGRVPGSILNAVFLIQELFYITIRCNQFSNLVRVYIVYFLTPQTVIIITTLLAAYASYKGLKVLSRANEILFVVTLPIVLAPAGALPYGDLLNIQPVLNTDLPNAFMNTLHSFDNYFGIEIALLIYPYFKDKSKFKKAGMISVALSAGILTWMTFITIYYLGIDIVPKFLWPVMTTVKAFNLRTIKNFSFIFLFFWVLSTLQTIMNNYFSAAFILKDFFMKSNINYLCIYLIPAVYFVSLQYGNEVMSREILGRILPVFTGFNIIFVTLIVLSAIIRKGKTNESP